VAWSVDRSAAGLYWCNGAGWTIWYCAAVWRRRASGGAGMARMGKHGFLLLSVISSSGSNSRSGRERNRVLLTGCWRVLLAGRSVSLRLEFGNAGAGAHHGLVDTGCRVVCGFLFGLLVAEDEEDDGEGQSAENGESAHHTADDGANVRLGL